MGPEEKTVFWSSFFEQKKTLESLIEESRESENFYLLLSISAFITTLGLLIDNVIIVIGGMLVAPLLSPILALSMGITTSSRESIGRSLGILSKSIILVLVLAVLSTFLFDEGLSGQLLISKIDATLNFFLVSFAAGVAAAYAWVKQNLSASMPGVAVSVALLPPLSAMGIGITYLDAPVISGGFTLFLVNLIGITLAGILVFSLFGFSRLQREEKELIKKEKLENLEEAQYKLHKTKEKLEEVADKIEETKEKDAHI